ncbi:TetR/AcrR family transcriptional regulator [Desulfomarina sp.]
MAQPQKANENSDYGSTTPGHRSSGKKTMETVVDSRQRILEAAVVLFARKGFGSTGLRQLAEKAQVNLAMINYFFGSKKALLKEILDIFFCGYLDIARRELAEPGSRKEKLDRFIHGAVNYFNNHRDYLLVTITELPHDDPEIIEHKANWGRQMVEIVEEHLGKEIKIHKDSSTPTAVFCTMLTSTMASRFLFGPVIDRIQSEKNRTLSINDYADTVSRLFLQSFHLDKG